MNTPIGFRGLPTSTTPAVAVRRRKPLQPVQVFETLENRQLMSGSVSGVVYNDLNVNNTIKPGDPMIAGVRVYADLGNHNAYKAGDPTAITNSQGKYTINGLNPGSYIIREVVPAHFRQTEPSTGGGQDVIITNNASNVTGINFGDTQKVRIGGFVYNDSNGNGKMDKGEEIVSGVAVYFDANGNKKQDANELHTTTNAQGYWVIGNLAPGKTFTARIVVPAGDAQVTPSANGAHVITLQKGQTSDNVLFGIRPSTVIFNSQTRTAAASGGSVSHVKSSSTVGIFDSTATAQDPSLGDGGTANISSHISANTIFAAGSLSTQGSHDEGEAFTTVDVTFTLSAATAYSTGYDIFGNNFSFQLKKLNNGGGNVINNVPSNDPSQTSYAYSNSGMLAAGKYELIFTAFQDNSNIFATNGYVMNFNI